MQPNERLQEYETAGRRLPAGARREQIVAEAAALFSANGYHGTSMQEIADHVGLLKGSLYAHVAGKEELLLEIVSTAARLFMEAVEPVVHSSEQPVAKLRLAMRGHLRVASTNSSFAVVFWHEWRHLAGRPAAWVREAHGRYEALWIGIFREGVAAGAFRPELDPALATAITLAVANTAIPTAPNGDASALMADTYIDALLAGFADPD